ncbi:protein jag [Deltaproteobacteria bacterium]|nr:protein jag [Deltaproteobacteria bacterium]
MNGYKEFEAKTLDDAIQDACAFYDSSREKLEIEILNDAKGGIFGLMGAKKARIRAKLVQLSRVLEGLDQQPEGKEKQRSKRGNGALHGALSEPFSPQAVCAPEESVAQGFIPPAPEGGRQKKQEQHHNAHRNNERKRHSSAPAVPAVSAMPAMDDLPFTGQASIAELFAKSSQNARALNGREDNRDAGREAGHENPARVPQKGPKGRIHREYKTGEKKSKESSPPRPEEEDCAGEGDLRDALCQAEEYTRIPFDQLDKGELETATREIVNRLVTSFLDNPAIDVTIDTDRVRVSITGLEDAGILIGRDGQTLASLQYLVTRMLSSRMNTLMRVQIDAGDYRARQDERLRELALSLAEKVKTGGRPQVTRPLSSYHRRVIHLTLQDDPLVQTHSKGEGDMKRVMIARKKPEKTS